MTDEAIDEVRALADEGRVFDAIDRARAAAEAADPESARRLRVQEAMLLARVGAREEARKTLRDYGIADHRDPLIGALKARLLKDDGVESGDPADLRRARDAYLDLALSVDPADRERREHCAANAATLSRLIDDMGPARPLIEEILAAGAADTYWSRATRAELLAALGAPEDKVR
ncbi:MAG: tetratricopeptide repeat-containing protein, partial [Pseudomonadota bacterium]